MVNYYDKTLFWKEKMKKKYLVPIIIAIIILIGVFFILNNKDVVKEDSNLIPSNEEEQKEIVPKINYQEDPNFNQMHPKGNQFSTGITGEEMNLLTLEENALIWEINPNEFVNEFNSQFKTNAKASDKLGNVLPEYSNSNRDVKILLDKLK